MKTALLRTDDVLRARPWIVETGDAPRKLLHLITILIFFGIIYGAVMGSFGGVFGSRFWQLVISGVKVPILLTATFGLSLPSFFVINTLFGLRSDFALVVRALIAAQAGLTIILASFAPITALWYASSANYSGAILFNALMFAVASVSAQVLLRRYYAPLIERNRHHRLMLKVWIIIYGFVGIQMGWVLRPFIGSPNLPPQFFREGAWGNAYVTLLEIFMRFFGA